MDKSGLANKVISYLIQVKNGFFAIKVRNQRSNAQFSYMLESVYRHTRKVKKKVKKNFGPIGLNSTERFSEFGPSAP